MAKRPVVMFEPAEPPAPINFSVTAKKKVPPPAIVVPPPAAPPPVVSDESAVRSRSRWPWHLLAAAVLAILIGLSYSNSFLSGWTLDNKYIIQLDPRNKKATWENFKLVWTQDYWYPKGISGLYRPVTSLSYLLNWADPLDLTPPKEGATDAEKAEYKKSRDESTPATRFVEWFLQRLPRGSGGFPTPYPEAQQVIGFHWVNLFLHFINALLAYALALAIIKRWWIALFAALIFAIHPVGTESVTNIIGRADQLGLLATLLGLLLYMRMTDAKPAARVGWFVAFVATVAIGFFSKESAVTVIAAVAIWDVTYRLGKVWFGDWLFRFLPMLALVMVPVLIATVVASRMEPHVPKAKAPTVTVNSTTAKESEKAPPTFAARVIDPTRWGDRFPAAWPVAIGCCVIALVLGASTVLVSDTIALALWGGAVFCGCVCAFAVPWLAPMPVLVALCGPIATRWLTTFTRCGEPANAWSAYIGPLFVAASSVILLLAIVPLTAAVNPLNRDAIAGQLGLYYWAVAVIIARLILALIDKSTWTSWIVWGVLACLLTIGLGVLRPWNSWHAPTLFVLDFAALAVWPTLVNVDLVAVRRRVLNFGLPYLALGVVFSTMLYTRNYIFLASTPPEEPFLDNPLRGPIEDFKNVSNQSSIESKLTAFKVLGMQVNRLLWPGPLSADYSYNQIPIFDWNLLKIENWHTIFCFGVTLLAIAASITIYRRNKPAFFFFWLFFLMMFPTSNIAFIIGAIMAERFMYLPLVGFAGLVALFIDWLIRRLGGSIVIGPGGAREEAIVAEPLAAAYVHAVVPTGILDYWNAKFAQFRYPLLHRLPWVAPLAVVLLIAGLAARTYARNFDWQSDVTLWESAIKVAPNAFRCHQSLAFAYYEKYCEDLSKGRPNVELLQKLIYVAEGGLPIVDDLPNSMNSSRLYLHLGMYYGIYAEAMMKKAADGQSVMTPEAQKWFERSAAVLERGSQVDRAFNEINRDREIRRGKVSNRENIADTGLAPVYQYLAYAYGRCGRFDLSLQAMYYWRQLSIADPEPYFKIADAYLQKQNYDQASVYLIEAMLLNADRPEAGRTLSQIYQQLNASGQGVPWGGISENGRVQLNPNNPLVRDHIVAAYRDLIRVFTWAKQEKTANDLYLVATTGYGLPPSLFEEALRHPGPAPTPPAPEFLKDRVKQYASEFVATTRPTTP